MAIFQNSLSNRNLTVRRKGVLIEELTETLDFNDDAFDVELINSTQAEVRVKLNVPALIAGQFQRVFVDSDYTTQEGDTYIGVDSTESVTITLAPGEFNGQTIIIKDETGNAVNRPIFLVPTSPDLIDDKELLRLQLRYIALQLVYIEENNQWRII